MKKFFDTVDLTSTGKPLEGATVRVLQQPDGIGTPAGDLATIYTDANGTETVSTGEVTTDADGYFEFYVTNGVYTFIYLFNGDSLRTITDVEVSEAVTAVELAADDGAELVGTEDGRTLADRLAELSYAQPQTHYFHAKMRADTYDVAVFLAGDSTGDATNEKFYLWAVAQAALFPEKTIIYRLWDDGAGEWGTPTTVATGTGDQTLYVDNFSVAGSSGYRIEGARTAAIFDGTRDYALAVWSYGHNYGTTVFEEDIGPSFIGQIAVFMREMPRAGILVTLQNPRITVDVGTTEAPRQTANAVAATLKAAMLLGCGIVDEYHAFLADDAWGIAPGVAGSLYLDDNTGTHHSIPAGVTVALNALLRATAPPETYARPSPLQPSPLLVKRRNLVPNAIFSDWPNGAAGPTGWTFTNCTPTKDAGRIDDAPYSLRCTNGAGAEPFIARDLGSILTHVRGHYITLVARVWKPTGVDAVAGRCFLSASNGAVATTATSPQRLPGESVDGWSFAITTLLVPQDSTSLTFGAFTGALDGSDVGEAVNFDHVAVFEGVLPGQIDPAEFPPSIIDELYDDANVGLPNTYGGTLTASGGDITLIGGSPAPARAYINLPSLVADESYEANWTDVSDTPGDGGEVILRNGFNGTGTQLDTATWSDETLTFVAPSGPCCLLLAGNGATTGFVQTGWSVRALSSGFDEFDLPLTSGRNSNGAALDATGGAGLFKIVSTPGTSLYLEGEGAQNNTKTDTVTFEATLPEDYLAGRPVTVTVNAIVAGTGTLGTTKTMTLTAYEIANNGTQGSNLGPAAKTLTTSAADYACTVTGTDLAPGDRLLLKLVTAINETGNVNPIEVRLNSVRTS